jgi:hypothetical protein
MLTSKWAPGSNIEPAIFVSLPLLMQNSNLGKLVLLGCNCDHLSYSILPNSILELSWLPLPRSESNPAPRVR